MKRRIATLLLLLGFAGAHVFSLQQASLEKVRLAADLSRFPVLPSPLLRIMAMEFDGVASDFLFLEVLVFYGGAIDRAADEGMKDWEWQWLYQQLQAASDLDPYFYDPYYFGNANLTWGGGMYREANALLDKGTAHRHWDWTLPFYSGFNHFYFLHEPEQAAEDLMVAAKRPGASPFFARFAARLAYQGRQTENAVVFLEGFLQTVEDETIRKEVSIRLEALRTILSLERAVSAFREQFGRSPQSLSELVSAGILSALPPDPYGGEFYLGEDGRVITTSNLRHLKR